MRSFLGILLLIALIVALRLSVFTVSAGEYAYVTVLGKHVATYDGADPEQAGLHVGWPWPFQSVQRLDRRLQYFDLGAQTLTYDPKGKTIDKTLTVEAYACWRIVDAAAVDRFVKKLGTAEQARSILGQRINSQLAAAVTRMRMDDLVNVEAGTKAGKTWVDEQIESLREKLLEELRTSVGVEYGIDLKDIRLRRFNYPEKVRDSIYARIRSERERKVAEYDSKAISESRKIESDADKEARDRIADARFKEEKLKGQADTEAMRIRNQAHQQDPEFYGFLKQMEKLQSILSANNTVLLLSAKRPLFDMLFQPPRPGTPGTGTPGLVAPKVEPKTGGMP